MDEVNEFYLVVGLLGIVLLLILLLIICNCCLSCCTRQKPSLAEDERYFQNVHALLERQKLMEEQEVERRKLCETYELVSRMFRFRVIA